MVGLTMSGGAKIFAEGAHMRGRVSPAEGGAGPGVARTGAPFTQPRSAASSAGDGVAVAE